VHDTVGMHAAHSRNDVVDHVAGLLLGKVVLFQNNIKQLPAFTIFGYYVLELPLFKNLIDFEDAWMVLNKEEGTSIFSNDISLRIIDLAFENLRVFTFLMALIFPVCSWVARKTSPYVPAPTFLMKR
jgi:hypothetical protein